MSFQNEYLVASRFFISSNIPKPSETGAVFSYNYYAADEGVNDTGDSRYDPRSFAGTSYLTDDQGNKLITDNLGRVVSEDVLTTRAPRHVEIFWTNADDTLTTLPVNLPSIELLDSQDKIIREEEISSLLDTNIRTFDQTLQRRLVNKFTNLSKIMRLEPHTNYSNWAISNALNFADRSFGSNTGFGWNTDYFDNSQDMVNTVMDMNVSDGVKRVNDLGQNVESPAFNEAQSLMLDI